MSEKGEINAERTWQGEKKKRQKEGERNGALDDGKMVQESKVREERSGKKRNRREGKSDCRR